MGLSFLNQCPSLLFQDGHYTNAEFVKVHRKVSVAVVHGVRVVVHSPVGYKRSVLVIVRVYRSGRCM